MKIIPKLFLAAGIICLLLSLFFLYQRNSPSSVSFKTKSVGGEVANYSQNQPLQISIPDLVIKLPITSEVISNGRFPVSDNAVIYLQTTPLPGETGNSILYGHNWRSLLGNLKNIKKGQIIEITYSNGLTKKFKVDFYQIVSPTNVEVLKQTADARLTLYTCSGFFDQQRLVVVAKLI